MRTLLSAALILATSPTFAAARYVRWDCKAFFSNNGYAYFYDGYSDWYPPSTWLDARYQQNAKDAALDACAEQSGGIRCFPTDCDKEESQ